MENNSYINDMIHQKLEWNSTLKKCQSLIDLQRMIILREYNIKNEDILEKYYLNDDITNKQSNDVINGRIKNIFNMNNYEQNIKNEAWHKDLSKIFLGLNDENKEKNGNAFFEYNYSNRNKKKEGLIFIRNFFRKMKSAKKVKNLYNKKGGNFGKRNKYNNLNIKQNKKEEKEEKKNEIDEINKIWDKICVKYGSNTTKGNLLKGYDYKNRYLTEMKNNNNYYSNIIKNNLKKLDLGNNTNNNTSKTKKKLFPEIITSNSSKNIKTNNKYSQYKSIFRNKTFNEKLKKVYFGNKNYNYLTINNDTTETNFDMPELLESRKFNFFKKNKKKFLSPLHCSKYEQMNEIKNKLIRFGFHDKDVFKIYNKNV